jgi:hypothetical protein
MSTDWPWEGLNLMPRLRNEELYSHSQLRLRGVVINLLHFADTRSVFTEPRHVDKQRDDHCSSPVLDHYGHVSWWSPLFGSCAALAESFVWTRKKAFKLNQQRLMRQNLNIKGSFEEDVLIF